MIYIQMGSVTFQRTYLIYRQHVCPWHWQIFFLKKLTLVLTDIVNIRVLILLFLWPNLFTGIKIFVLVTLAIFGIGHYRGHLCFRNTFFFLFSSQKTIRLNKMMVIHPFAKCGKSVSKSKDDFARLQIHREIMIW